MSTPDFITVTPILSSISPLGLRIDTLKIRSPRMIHADFMTHRKMSRNSSSSRAMPSGTLLRDEPYVPRFAKNQRGMQAGDWLSPAEQAAAEAVWMRMVTAIQEGVRELSDKNGLNVHKQWANRPTEWFGYITKVVTSTQWTNYLALRDHGDAQPEIQAEARAVRAALISAKVQELDYGKWHLPFISWEDEEAVDRLLHGLYAPPPEVRSIAFAFHNLEFLPWNTRLLLAISAARCARTSYLNFYGSPLRITDDIGLFCKLGGDPIHASPFEHQARPCANPMSTYRGNLEGWEQFRKFIPNECL